MDQPAAPLYRQILEQLRQRIAAGTYPIGASLPTENMLCAEFGASRHTVREALRGLVELGVVARRQGSGSVVTAATPPAVYLQSIHSLAELFQFALTTHYTVQRMRMVVPAEKIRAAIGGAPGLRWLMVSGVRRERPDGAPICITHSYIPERLAWLGPELPDCVGPFYAHIETRSAEPIIEAVQDISAEAMRPDMATALDQPAGSIALRVLRRYVGANGTLIASFNWHPADHFVYRMQLQRSTDHHF